MNRINRRRFVAVTSVAATSVVLVACGNEPSDEDELNPTQIPDVAGAPPTLAPITSTPGAASSEGDGGNGEAAEPEALTITMHDDFSFDPADPEVYPGQVITVVNEGFMEHDLVSDDLGIGTELVPSGESAELTIPEDAAVGETFHFICTVSGHEQSGMVGDFTIVEAGSAAPAAAGTEGEGEEEAATEGEGEASPEAETASATPAADNNPMATTVIGTQWEFVPAEFEMAPGGILTFQNDTDMQMGLSSEEWDDESIPFIRSINDGRTAEFQIPADAEVGSTIEFTSNLSTAESLGMTGTITIVEGDGTAVASPAASPEASPASGSGDAVVIEASDDFKFSPDSVEVTPGQTLALTNVGFMEHDLVCEDLDIATELLRSNETEEFTIPEDAAVGETFRFICTVAGHEQSGMVGEFIIV